MRRTMELARNNRKRSSWLVLFLIGLALLAAGCPDRRSKSSGPYVPLPDGADAAAAVRAAEAVVRAWEEQDFERMLELMSPRSFMGDFAARSKPSALTMAQAYFAARRPEGSSPPGAERFRALDQARKDQVHELVFSAIVPGDTELQERIGAGSPPDWSKRELLVVAYNVEEKAYALIMFREGSQWLALNGPEEIFYDPANGGLGVVTKGD